MDHIELVAADNPALLLELSALAHVIWHQHYTPIIGREQVEYMLDGGYSEHALNEQMAAGTRFTLARRGERYVAFVAVSPDADDPDTAWLDKLYVHIEARNLGVGRRLVQRAADQAREFGAATLRLRVNRHNAESITAYRRLGFETEYEDVKDIGHGFVMDDYVMAAPVERIATAVG
ncbi:N-acetyltransferase [Salinisphaera sp. LB1]|uniref:GNAT family N-acetyltransferase n=1 Tax=Salinisphaera sp. LB1 TaxID=2183911 RepID=UPI000D70869C|nr:GNAT family N-acetyltransferase [Salinisphaera sp. LB1]AWN15364.1 GCN5-related N-acetyltransferase [Salinisphaera sp. LB1]